MFRTCRIDVLGDCNHRITHRRSDAHAHALKNAFPAERNKIRVLSPAISDPFGGGDDVYERCAAELEDALRRCLPPRREP